MNSLNKQQAQRLAAKVITLQQKWAGVQEKYLKTKETIIKSRDTFSSQFGKMRTSYFKPKITGIEGSSASPASDRGKVQKLLESDKEFLESIDLELRKFDTTYEEMIKVYQECPEVFRDGRLSDAEVNSNYLVLLDYSCKTCEHALTNFQRQRTKILDRTSELCQAHAKNYGFSLGAKK